MADEKEQQKPEESAVEQEEPKETPEDNTEEQASAEAQDKAPEESAAEEPPVETVEEKSEEEPKKKPVFPVKFILGRKLGMGSVYDVDGNVIPVTYIEAGPCYVTQIKDTDKDGYNSVQIAFGSKRKKHINKPLFGHLKKAGIESAKHLKEVRVNDTADIELGQEVKVDIFSTGDMVNITGTSKGLGFQGTVRRHGFAGGPKTHGQSDRLRAPGSIGQSSDPSRVFKGIRMPGRMGNDTVTTKNLKVVAIDEENNCLVVKGAVPGKRNSFVKVAVSNRTQAQA
ncbi:MAG: 50S ribosomal protein L3 [candidate division Zixibacteria bacterium]|nr:50S ribosomal protein L3 [candidate division Zixibacteria bacterium]